MPLYTVVQEFETSHYIPIVLVTVLPELCSSHNAIIQLFAYTTEVPHV